MFQNLNRPKQPRQGALLGYRSDHRLEVLAHQATLEHLFDGDLKDVLG